MYERMHPVLDKEFSVESDIGPPVIRVFWQHRDHGLFEVFCNDHLHRRASSQPTLRIDDDNIRRPDAPAVLAHYQQEVALVHVAGIGKNTFRVENSLQHALVMQPPVYECPLLFGSLWHAACQIDSHALTSSATISWSFIAFPVSSK